MKITDAAAQIEKAVETAATALPPDPDMKRKDDLEKLIRKMDFRWGNGVWVTPLGHRKVMIQEDGEGLFIEVKGKQLRGRNLILYIIGGNRYDTVALVQIAFDVLDGKSDPERFCRTNSYEASEKNPAHRMMMLVQNAICTSPSQACHRAISETARRVKDTETQLRSHAALVEYSATRDESKVEPEQPHEKLADAGREADVMKVLKRPSTDLGTLLNQIVQTGLDLLLCEIQVGLVLVDKKASMVPAKYKSWKRAALPTWDRRKMDEALRCGTYITRVKRLRGGRLEARDVLQVDKKAIIELGGPDEAASKQLLQVVMQKVDNGERINEKDVRELLPSRKTRREKMPAVTDFPEFYAYAEKVCGDKNKRRKAGLLLLVRALDPDCPGEKPDAKLLLNAAIQLLPRSR